MSEYDPGPDLFGGVPWSEWTELYRAVSGSRKEQGMRFTVQATRTVTTNAPGAIEWTRIEQVPTFWVEACSEENAEQIARDVLGGPEGSVNLTVTKTE